MEFLIQYVSFTLKPRLSGRGFKTNLYLKSFYFLLKVHYIWLGCCTGGRKGVYPMNNAAMSGTHYPLDKEPRGRNEDDDSLRGRRRKVKISSKAMDSVSS